MATRNFAYDHPAYLVPIVFSGVTTSGASAVSVRYGAFTNLVAKAATFHIVIAGTATAHNWVISKISGTTTTAISTYAASTNAAATTTNVLLNNTALAQGDQLVTKSGADTVGVASVTYELLVAPGSSLTE